MTDLAIQPQPAAPERKGKISIRERAAVRVCPNCGKPSPERRSTRGPAPLYCRAEDGRDCKREMNNRDLTDGAALVPLLKAWRIDRGTGEIAQGAFQRMCKMVDELNDADRTANRPRADYRAAVLLASNAQPVNELRYGRRKIAESAAREAANDLAPVEEAAPAVEPTPQPLDLAEILRMIADGHNDARSLAAEALAKLGR